MQQAIGFWFYRRHTKYFPAFWPLARRKTCAAEGLETVQYGAMRMARPVINDLERSGTDITLEVLAFAGLIVLLAVPAYFYGKLPASVPRHFNIRGEPDGWGGKNVLLLMPAIGVLIYAGLTTLSRFPHILNYPWAITEANARRQYAITRQLLSAVKLILVVTFVYTTWAMIGTAMGSQHGLSTWFMTLETPILFATIGFYLFQAKRAQ
jgi:uncharacterized membrane protein